MEFNEPDPGQITGDSIVIDERTGDAGRVLSLRTDASAWVRFPGPGGTDRIVDLDDLNLAEDQAWEPEVGRYADGSGASGAYWTMRAWSQR